MPKRLEHREAALVGEHQVENDDVERLRGHALDDVAGRRQELDVILNSNTPESAGDQYTSMVLERTVVDRVRRAPVFVQMLPSSEIAPSALAPGLTPTLVHGGIESGEIARPVARVAAA